MTSIVLPNGDTRGVMVDPRPRKCRPVQVTLADGTTQIVTVCKSVLSQPTCGAPSWARRVAISVTARPT